MGFLGKLVKPVSGIVHNVTKPVNNITSGIGDGFSSIGSGIGAIGKGIGSGVKSFADVTSNTFESITSLVTNPIVIIGVGIGAIFLLQAINK